jgi:cytochrome c
MLPVLLAAGAALVAAAALVPPPEPRVPGGERLYQLCYGCHSLRAGENLPSGPTLYAIVGKPVAAETGFAYSPALRRFASRNPRWTPELLDRFIIDPEALAPGTYMAFHGLTDPAQRAALIEFLRRN